MKQLSITKKVYFFIATICAFVFFYSGEKIEAVDTCTINSAHFTTYGEQPASFYESNELVDNPENPKPQVSISINTSGCEGKTINTSLINIAQTPAVSVPALKDKALVVPEGGILNITLRAGENGCNAIAGSFDCKYFIKIVTSDGIKYRTKDSHITNIFNGTWTVLDDPKGVLLYEQRGPVAGDGWVFEQSNGGTPTPIDPTPATTTNTEIGSSNYELISDLPLLTELGEDLDNIPDGSGIGGVLNALFTVAIGVAGILAVVMMIYHAWEYLTTESITTKVLLKDKLLKIVLGILLLFGSTIILRTINPDLLNLEPQIIQLSEVGDDGQTSVPISYSENYQENNACPGPTEAQPNETCITYPPSIKMKGGIGKFGERNFVQKINTLSQSLAEEGITWRITEAWPPTRVHSANCHKIGTCIDANHSNEAGTESIAPTNTQIKKFIEKANESELCAIYEVSSESQKQELIQAGIPSQNVKNYGTWISAAHYSIYGGTCD